MKKYHNVGHDEINNMYPFERDIKVALINADIEKENQAGKEYTP